MEAETFLLSIFKTETRTRVEETVRRSKRAEYTTLALDLSHSPIISNLKFKPNLLEKTQANKQTYLQRKNPTDGSSNHFQHRAGPLNASAARNFTLHHASKALIILQAPNCHTGIRFVTAINVVAPHSK